MFYCLNPFTFIETYFTVQNMASVLYVLGNNLFSAVIGWCLLRSQLGQVGCVVQVFYNLVWFFCLFVPYIIERGLFQSLTIITVLLISPVVLLDFLHIVWSFVAMGKNI